LENKLQAIFARNHAQQAPTGAQLALETDLPLPYAQMAHGQAQMGYGQAQMAHEAAPEVRILVFFSLF